MKKYTSLLASIMLATAILIFLAITVRYCDFCYNWFAINFEELINIILRFLPKLLIIFLLFVAFQMISNFVIKGLVKSTVKRVSNQGRSKVITQFAVFIWWSLYVIIVLIILVGNLGSLVTSIGLIGLGLTFALQKPILNLGGYITIAFANVYNEGDRISIGNVIGDVKEIRLMNTVVEGLLEGTAQPSGKLFFFPNEFVLTQEVENYTQTSNYVLEELKISITYESDYNKAMKLLKDIVTERVKRSRSFYKKNILKQEKTLNIMIKSLRAKKAEAKGKSEEILAEQENKLREKKEKLADEIRELEEEFKPKVRMEFLDSAIEIIAFFQTPYNKIKYQRSRINNAFMNAIADDPSIEIAYPHMELVYPKNKIGNPKKKKH